MATNSGWSKSVPSGTSKISSGDDEIRSFKSYMQEWWEEEHYGTDGSANSAGVHKHGSARAFVGTTSQLSNPTGDNDGRLFFDTVAPGLYVADGSASTWKIVTNAITLASQQTWTALQEFSAGVETSDLSLDGIFSGWTSYSTFTDLASIASNNVLTWFATDGVAANVAPGDFLVANKSTPDAFAHFHATAGSSAGSIVLSVINTGTGALNPSAQTYTVMIFKRGHLGG